MAQARIWTSEMACALNRLHDMDILYGDLKIENVMIDVRGHIKLTDFGLSSILTPPYRAYKISGTFHYMAPGMNEALHLCQMYPIVAFTFFSHEQRSSRLKIMRIVRATVLRPIGGRLVSCCMRCFLANSCTTYRTGIRNADTSGKN